MKKSEVKKDLKTLKESLSYMYIHGTGHSSYRGEVTGKIEIYERLLKEGYEDDSKTQS